ncbi:hypothetical protein [Palleniella muris]|nr:hypothetical protein [Palleniella muris]
MKADKKLYEACKLLDQPISQVRDKVIGKIDEFLEKNGIVEITSMEIF